ncbi:hypothetical protein [Limnohabitans parvus]|uniref:Uncharacterized protein n=1 Tax=Limnohabitans parvus II-B4 TaxID=1293052 RepID=A0A315EA43_9BURK|nr:hypothetical protein [Limnohabitans parvus]PUE53959.1 hypothetical protein B9Z37_05090 [Limnohabitans parvus II-B4]
MSRLLLKLLLLPPDLLKMHAHGYADLASEEWERQRCIWKTRLLMAAMGTASGVLGLFLAGVSLLLWSALPVVDGRSAWVMWFLPMALGLFSLACWAWARHIKMPPPFDKLKTQIALDILALRQSPKA